MRVNNTYSVVLDKLEKKFGNFTAVNKISLKVTKGEIFGFLGPNGAGKSTTIRMLCGLLKPTSGTGTVAGVEISKNPENVKTKIGYMSQKFSLYGDLKVKENLDFYAGIYRINKKEREDRKSWALKMSGLEKQKNILTRSLPVGWKQKLALGCAVMHNPSILFLDEPTSGVDPSTRRKFWDLIYQMSDDGVSVFVTTHYMQEAEYCHRLGMIFQGDLIAKGTPGELKKTKMDGDVFEIFCDHPYEALSILEEEHLIKEVSLYGGGLHIVTDDKYSKESNIRQMLKKNNISFSSLKKIPPSLEDIFVSLTRSFNSKKNHDRDDN